MKKSPFAGLSRREREVMDILYRRGRATAAEVQDELPDPPTYSAVRAALRLLEERGHIRHEQEGPRYIYLPTVPREKARTKALDHLLSTFFNGSAEQVVNTLVSETKLAPEELERLAELIERARGAE
jgi:predicted transcriptional regulator